MQQTTRSITNKQEWDVNRAENERKKTIDEIDYNIYWKTTFYVDFMCLLMLLVYLPQTNHQIPIDTYLFRYIFEQIRDYLISMSCLAINNTIFFSSSHQIARIFAENKK